MSVKLEPEATVMTASGSIAAAWRPCCVVRLRPAGAKNVRVYCNLKSCMETEVIPIITPTQYFAFPFPPHSALLCPARGQGTLSNATIRSLCLSVCLFHAPRSKPAQGYDYYRALMGNFTSEVETRSACNMQVVEMGGASDGIMGMLTTLNWVRVHLAQNNCI